ncbi:MAG: hypothetical protein K2N47_03535, partial [Clostridia bacterium]|nr:hypothetical protein [Clostridia bacterium]
MKKLKNIKKIAAVLLSVTGASAMSVGVAGCIKSSTTVPMPDNIEITKVAPPADGSLPTAHTCAENLSYINYVFDHQTQYHTYSYGVTSASIATQTTRTFRDFKDGVLITTDFTHSSIIKSGSQTCTVFNDEGEGEVYFRTSEAPKSDTIPTGAVWDENAPTYFSQNAYHYTYGLLPTELFNYITNEDTVVTSGEVQVNADGTYSQSFTLDPVASTYFYQFGMKTRGGLSSYPDFSSISFTITFDGDWQILSSSMHEVAKVNKGILVDSISDFTCEYWYGEDHFDQAHYDYYENYYKKFLGDENLEQGGSEDDKLVVDVTSVLSNGFSQILNGGQQFEVTLKLGDNIYKGYIFLSLDLADPLGTLALKASLGRSLKNLDLYIEYGEGGLCAYYGNDFALSANLAEVKLAIGEFGEIVDGIKNALAKGVGHSEESNAAEEEGEDPLGALMNQMVLTATETQATLVLDTDDLLGLGIGIQANFKFGISGNTITFRGGSVGGISLGGEVLDLAVNLAATTAPVISRDENIQGGNIADYIADVHSLLSSDLIKVHAVIDGNAEKVSVSALKGLKADVTAFADINGITVGAVANVSYIYNDTPVSATVRIDYGYNGAIGGYGEALLTLTELNGKSLDIKLGCNIEQLVEAISTLISFGGGEKEASRSLVQTLNGALSQNLTNLLTELYADNAKIKIGVSVDDLLSLLSVNTGVKFGSCTLVYARGEGGGLSAALPALGFEMSVCGADGELAPVDRSGALELVYVIDDVKEILNSDLITLNINLDGKQSAVSALNGLQADLTAYFNKEQLALAATANVSYTLGENTVSAALGVNYDNALNCALVSLDNINGVALNAKVKCNIGEIATAVTNLLQYADVKTNPFEEGGFDLNGIVSGLLSADLDKLLPVAETTTQTLDLALDVDELLNILNVNLGTELGRLSLAYDHCADEKLVAKMPALGLAVGVSGAEGAIQAPDYEGALDLTDLVNTVSAAIEQVNGIINGKSLAFNIERGATFLSLDGIVVEIWGQGEVSWQSKNEYVALNLSMAITEGKKNSDISTLRLVYDKNADSTPFVRLALNQVGLDIYKDDIESVKNGFNEIYNKIKALFGAQTTAQSGAAQGETSLDESVDFSLATMSDEISGKDALVSILFGLISSQDWVKVLGDLTLTSNGKSLALDYFNANSNNGANVIIGADGGLSLKYSANLGERFSLGGSVNVSALGNSMLDSLNGEFEANCNMSSSKDGGAGFVHLAYDFLFDAIHYISVENILGSDTYTVSFMLDGDSTDAEALQGVYVQAEIYITGEGEDNGKLAEGLLKVEIDGVGIDLNVITERRFNPATGRENAYFYMNLKQVASVKLPDLKMVATQDSLFDTFNVIYRTVNDTNILDLVKGLVSNGSASEAETTEVSAVPAANEQDKLKAVADLLGKLLEFNFSEAFVGSETDGVFDGTIYLDSILNQLGINAGTFGNLAVKINHNDHSMTTSGKTQQLSASGAAEDKTWISLSSALTERRSYTEFKREQYISIEFLPTLVEDIVNTATDDEGKLYDKFTFSGKITAKAGISFINVDINLDVFTLTAGFDQNGGLFVSAVFHIERVSAMGLVTIPDGTLGLTYKNGYLTLARNLTGTPEYKVMTFDYFVDHMLTDANSSVLRWWLNVSGWDTLLGVLKLIPSLDLNNINSGLSTPENVY